MTFVLFLQTEKEDQTGFSGKTRGADQAAEANYYDDGPSMMPASESFAGNQPNWGASAADGWGAGTGAESNEWNAANASNTAVATNW